MRVLRPQDLLWERGELALLARDIEEEEGLPVIYEGPIFRHIPERYAEIRIDRASRVNFLRTTPHLPTVFKTKNPRILQEKEEEMAAHFFMASEYGDRIFDTGSQRLRYTLQKMPAGSDPDFKTHIGGETVRIEVTTIADPRTAGLQHSQRVKYRKELTNRFPGKLVLALIDDYLPEPDLAQIIKTSPLLDAPLGASFSDTVRTLVQNQQINQLYDFSAFPNLPERLPDVQFVGYEFPSYFFQIKDAIDKKTVKPYADGSVDLVIIDKTGTTPRALREDISGLLQMYGRRTPFRRIVVISPYIYKIQKRRPTGEFWYLKVKDPSDPRLFDNFLFCLDVFRKTDIGITQLRNPLHAREILTAFYG